MTGFRRWAAILLPFVIAARIVLFVFQDRNDRSERAHANDPPAWPPVAGEELRFRSDNPHVADWVSAPDRPRLVVPISERDYLPADPGTGCVLDPAALQRHRGTLTLRSATPAQSWTAEWSGGGTMPTLDEVRTGQVDTYVQQVESHLLADDGGARAQSDAYIRAMDANVLRAADCGGASRLELSEWDVHVLVNLLAGDPLPPSPDPPAPGPPAPGPALRIVVERPPP